MAEDVKCPQCGTPMQAPTTAPADSLADANLNSGANPSNIARKTALLKKKDAELGPIYTCPRDGYHMRVKSESATDGAWQK